MQGDGGEVLGDCGLDASEGFWLLVEDLLDEAVGGVAVEDRGERGHLVEGGPEAVDVGPLVHFQEVPLELLGRGVAEGTDEFGALGGEALRAVAELREAEVHHDEAAAVEG